MGVIYLAHDPVIDRKVAIKLIRADLLSGEEQADYLARFQHEAQAAGRCAHPNIVAIYDFARARGQPVPGDGICRGQQSQPGAGASRAVSRRRRRSR